MSETGQSELDLRVFLHIVRRRLWVILLVPALVAAVAFVTAKAKTPQYRSSAEILIARTDAETIFNTQGVTFNDPSRLLANQIRVMRSQDVTNLVKQRLGFDAKISADASKTEDVITITAVDREAARAAAIVNAYAQVYLDFRRSSRTTQNATIQAQLHLQIDPAEARLRKLDDALAQTPPAQRDAVQSSQTAERELILTNLAPQRAQLAQLEAAANVEQGGAQLLAPAPVPRFPFEPNPKRSVLLGLAVGLMLAFGVALLLDYLDNRVRTKEDLERCNGNLPIVGMIPTVAGWRNKKETHVISVEEPTSATAEAYRSLRTAIQFIGLDRSLRTLQITSPASADGKTTTLVNLAVALARAGQRVVIIDCDLRRPRIHQFFGLQASPGFTSVLMGDVALSEAVQPAVGIDRLLILPAGPVPPNPSELLSGERTAQILESLKNQADVVLIDSPPVLPVSDAAVLSTRVDGTLMVASANRTQRKQMTRAVELLRQVEARVVGTVLNRASVKGEYGGYTYGYKPDSSPVGRTSKANGNGTAKAATATSTSASNGQNGSKPPDGGRRTLTGRRKP